ncbi:TLC domain-containing protein 2-like [Anabrus simplex]|uniref:TLC domain-containing protein 2-like n=1 Tax=Anabrus simplex TaxID=316456 RepID=UPI0035A3BF7D
MDPATLKEPNLGYLWACASAAVFTLNSFLLRFIVPRTAKQNVKQEWKWRNTVNSLIHSLITGLWSCLCFWETPEVREDLISTYTVSAHGVISLSTGYFAYDLADMLLNHRKRSSYELMIHHVLVIICFGLSVSTRYYIGYGLVALLVEVNSVFLHIRQLLLIHSVSKTGLLYRFNSFLNLGTFLVFRILTLGWMFRWLVLHKEELTGTAFTTGIVSLSIIMVMNIVLFMRVMNGDYVRRPARQGATKQVLLDDNQDWAESAKVKDS